MNRRQLLVSRAFGMPIAVLPPVRSRARRQDANLGSIDMDDPDWLIPELEEKLNDNRQRFEEMNELQRQQMELGREYWQQQQADCQHGQPGGHHGLFLFGHAVVGGEYIVRNRRIVDFIPIHRAIGAFEMTLLAAVVAWVDHARSDLGSASRRRNPPNPPTSQSLSRDRKRRHGTPAADEGKGT